MVAVPISATRIPAYTRVTRDHLWNPNTQNLAVVYLPKEQVTPETFTQINQILGRVLDHDKQPAFTFTEADFLPRGTRAGLVGGIPAGKRAMRVDAAKVQGLVGLNPGDRFDLVATIPIDPTASTTQTFQVAGVYGQQLALQNQLTNWQKQATVRVLVQNGMIVEPMASRNVPVNVNTLTQGMVTRNKVVQEIVIAVDPEEVARLTEAMAVSAEINSVPRSGSPDDPEDSITPDLQPWNPFVGLVGNNVASQEAPVGGLAPGVASGPFTTVETIVGSKREMVATPRQR
jgi:Flp pilus assembly protein CpaB